MDDSEDDGDDGIAVATELFFVALAAIALASRLADGLSTERECWRVASLLCDAGRKVQDLDPAHLAE